MDGVLIENRSSWKVIHKTYNIDNSDLFKEFYKGKLGDEEFLNKDIKRMREYGLTKEKIEIALNNIKYTKGLKECIEFAKNIGKTAIISGGVKCIADKIAKYGINFVFANEIEFVDDKPFRGILNVPFRRKDIILESLMKEIDVKKENVIVIGDSKYDVSMFKLAGLSIAFNPFDDIVKEKANIVVDSNDMKDLIHILKNYY